MPAVIPSVASAYRQVVPGIIEVPYPPHADVNPVALLPMSEDSYPVLTLGDFNGLRRTDHLRHSFPRGRHRGRWYSLMVCGQTR